MRSLRIACAGRRSLLLVGFLSAACSASDPVATLEEKSPTSDNALQSARGHAEAADSQEDAAEPVDTLDDAPSYQECSGPPYGTGTCETGQICAAMPRVPFKYCMPRPPCDDGMVEVTAVACAYPCEQNSDCEKHQLPHCAPNDLAYVTHETKGWCTP